jgi:indole-3-glycerol phosphate synthase
LDTPPAPDFLAALRQPELTFIAEVKRKSPSAGTLDTGIDAADQAIRYEGAGAGAVSILTETRYFGGSLSDLESVRGRVTVPVLRKDFTVDEHQIWEARTAGASAVLLIAALLDRFQLQDFQQLADTLGLASIVEVHDECELEMAISTNPRIVGINNRDLRTMAVDLETTERLLKLIPSSIQTIGESGIRSTQDVRRMARARVNGVLIGEALMRTPDPACTLASFMHAARTSR